MILSKATFLQFAIKLIFWVEAHSGPDDFSCFFRLFYVRDGIFPPYLWMNELFSFYRQLLMTYDVANSVEDDDPFLMNFLSKCDSLYLAKLCLSFSVEACCHL
jgi:hypothetical protein